MVIIFRLAGLIRHHLANESGIRSTPERYTNGSASIKTSTPDHNSPSSNDQEPMDYRCYTQSKTEPSEVRSFEKRAAKLGFRNKIPNFCRLGRICNFKRTWPY